MANMIFCRSAPGSSASNNGFILEYLAEGAANLIFSIRHLDPTQDKPDSGVLFYRREYPHDEDPVHADAILDKVLRIPKAGMKTPDSLTIQAAFDNIISPLFTAHHQTSEKLDYGEHLLEHIPISLSSAVVQRLNAELKVIVRARKEPVSISEEVPIGLLVTDMSSKPAEHVYTIEFKPKWLAQSPNAPPKAWRCRTCALRAKQVHDESDEKKKAKKRGDEGYMCPLRLVAGEKEEAAVEMFVDARVQKQILSSSQLPAAEHEAVVKAMLAYLTTGAGSSLLQHLRTLQQLKDATGVLNPVGELYWEGLRVAMTLRDCSLYLRAVKKGEGEGEAYAVDAKLGDLDHKSPEKFDDWKDKEQSLLEGGWYDRQPLEEYETCALAVGAGKA